MITITRWSIINAILLGTIMILLFHFSVCKRKYIIGNAMKPYMAMLLLLFARIAIPIDSEWFYVKKSTRMLTRMNDVMSRDVINSLSCWDIAFFVWIAGAILAVAVWAINLYRDIHYSNKIRSVSERIPLRYSEIAREIGIDSNRVYLSDFVDEVITIGIKDYMVVIPNVEYTDKDLYNIFSHEAAHILHKDILVKMLLHLFGCIMWWNPVVKLLERDYSILMEYRSDESVVKNCSYVEKISYVETMKKMAVIRAEYEHKYRRAAAFAISSQSTLVSRAQRVLKNRASDKKKVAGILAAEFILFAMSYLVIVQPYYDATPEYVEGEVTVNRDSAYLEQIDGGYKLYINGEDWGVISEDELHYEPYCVLEVRK